MRVIDLTPEHESAYFCCLEEWSEDMQDSGEHKACWYRKYRDRGLRVKLAADDAGRVGGMIQYLPIEASFVAGEGLYFVLCIWVHGRKQGRGDYQGRGMGAALLAAAEEDARARGAQGMAAWGLALPFWMKASWFKRHGYRGVDREFISTLVWKPFVDDAVAPRWVRQRKPVAGVPGKVCVTAFKNGWCPAQNITFERARRAAQEFGDKVLFREVDTTEPRTFEEWGIADGVFVDGKRANWGPPLAYDKLRKLIEKRAKRL
jgi:GNAT superfamily N-acetyltransferase